MAKKKITKKKTTKKVRVVKAEVVGPKTSLIKQKTGKREPGARGPFPEKYKSIKVLGTMQFRTIMFDFFQLKKSDLKKICRDKDTPVLPALISSVLHEAIEYGDLETLKWFMEKTFGSAAKNVNVNHSGNVNVTSFADWVANVEES